MSKERELLNMWRCIAPFMIDPAYEKVRTLTDELLAKPEPEPDYYLWHDEVHEEHPTNEGDPDVYPLYLSPHYLEPLDLDQVDAHWILCDKSEDYRDGYCDGIIFAEREHDIRGKHE